MTSPTPSLPAAIRETTVQEQNDLGKTKNDQPQEPEPTRPTSVALSIPLGARVRFARYIEKVPHGYQSGHTWVVATRAGGEGVFVGYRYKQDGRWKEEGGWDYDRGSRYWQESKRVKVALVVTHAWQEPWTVDPVGLEVVATDSLAGASVPAVDRSRSSPANAVTPPPIGTPPEDTTP